MESAWKWLVKSKVVYTLAPSGAGNGDLSITTMADSLYSSLSHRARAVDNPKTPDPMMRMRAGMPLLDDMMTSDHDDDWNMDCKNMLQTTNKGATSAHTKPCPRRCRRRLPSQLNSPSDIVGSHSHSHCHPPAPWHVNSSEPRLEPNLPKLQHLLQQEYPTYLPRLPNLLYASQKSSCWSASSSLPRPPTQLP